MKKRWKSHIIALVGILVFSMLAMGKATSPAPVERVDVTRVHWAEHTIIPNKDYEVVGTIVIRNVNERTLLADLMDQAVVLGGHDIKNVRLTVLTIDGERSVTAATAVAIRYTETLRDGEGNPVGFAISAEAPAPVVPEETSAPARRGVRRW